MSGTISSSHHTCRGRIVLPGFGVWIVEGLLGPLVLRLVWWVVEYPGVWSEIVGCGSGAGVVGRGCGESRVAACNVGRTGVGGWE